MSTESPNTRPSAIISEKPENRKLLLMLEDNNFIASYGYIVQAATNVLAKPGSLTRNDKLSSAIDNYQLQRTKFTELTLQRHNVEDAILDLKNKKKKIAEQNGDNLTLQTELKTIDDQLSGLNQDLKKIKSDESELYNAASADMDVITKFLNENKVDIIFYNAPLTESGNINDNPKIKEKILELIKNEVPNNTQYDMFILGGGHGDPQATGGLEKDTVQELVRVLKEKQISCNCIGLGSCYSAMHLPRFYGLLSDNGIALGVMGMATMYFVEEALNYATGQTQTFLNAEYVQKKNELHSALGLLEKKTNMLHTFELPKEYQFDWMRAWVRVLNSYIDGHVTNIILNNDLYGAGGPSQIELEIVGSGDDNAIKQILKNESSIVKDIPLSKLEILDNETKAMLETNLKRYLAGLLGLVVKNNDFDSSLLQHQKGLLKNLNWSEEDINAYNIETLKRDVYDPFIAAILPKIRLNKMPDIKDRVNMINEIIAKAVPSIVAKPIGLASQAATAENLSSYGIDINNVQTTLKIPPKQEGLKAL